MQPKVFPLMGYIKETWSSTGVHCRSFLVDFINKLYSPENKFLTRRCNISYIISKRKFGDFCTMSNLVLSHVIDLFAVNKLV
jgi:hypothetical protein